MHKVLVSSCLLGNKVRYDGRDLLEQNQILADWAEEGRIVAICPEVSAGLPVPRPPAEIQGGDGATVLSGIALVVESSGRDVSRQFVDGAKNALQLCKKHNIQVAILTESSPSCGSSTIYNGEFMRVKRDGLGVTAALLTENQVKVFSQHNVAQAAAYICSLSE